jgi:nitrite reductase/ring-hydroxylating ferredoxin subunit
VLGTLPAAATGVADWRDLRGETRRIGTLHALLNITGLLFNTASLVLRASDRRAAGKTASALGFLASSMAAHIGGELSFGLGVRVNRTAWQRVPDEFVAAAAEHEIQPGELKRVMVDEVPVLVTRARSGGIGAIAATCSHFGGPLDEGTREGDTVVCPWHGSRFDLCTGEVIDAPAVFAQPRYETRLRDGNVELRLSAR